MIEYYLHPEQGWGYFLLSFSVIGIALSFTIPNTKQFEYRWLFGASITALFITFGLFLTSFQESKSTHIFKPDEQAYRAQIVDSPKQKENSIMLALYLPDYDRKVAAYIETTPLSERLNPGDYIYFYAKLDTIKSYDTPNNFDYAQYMHNKGFSASTYISAQRWDFCHETKATIKTEALKLRKHILDFYESLDLSEKEFAILSALTLGYKDYLPEDIIDDFRTTGTAHILAISNIKSL